MTRLIYNCRSSCSVYRVINLCLNRLCCTAATLSMCGDSHATMNPAGLVLECTQSAHALVTHEKERVKEAHAAPEPRVANPQTISIRLNNYIKYVSTVI